MIHTLYVEEEVAEHPRTREVCERFPRAVRILCRRYGEIFNRKAQNFRLQKRNPALILARKHGRLVLETPPGYGLGDHRHFYFSHMLNCLYDCRYCFLQGMYRSAHYVLFVNYEDFRSAIEAKISGFCGETCFFYSGYDCDSLAFEPVTRFAENFLPFFAGHPEAWTEFRTKSTQIQVLLERKVIPNCVVAFSFTPLGISETLEHRVPPIEKRLKAMKELQERGWKLGLRFDPLIYQPDFRAHYERLYSDVFRVLRPEGLHSVSLGPFRLPKSLYENMYRLYPDEKLFAISLEERKGVLSYPRGLEEEVTAFCTRELLRHIPGDILFPCHVPA
ncbi:MAG: DNA photolyase [Planctomycetes bacterium]|nr:DNA photolyase [Planctomycetota bacterium]